ncbi:MAG: hypothetical protein ACK55I_41950, partial [bacterium]
MAPEGMHHREVREGLAAPVDGPGERGDELVDRGDHRLPVGCGAEFEATAPSRLGERPAGDEEELPIGAGALWHVGQLEQRRRHPDEPKAAAVSLETLDDERARPAREPAQV